MMARALFDRIATLHRDRRGQMAILFVLTLLVVFILFALAFDAGLWYFDHRSAQNQSEAAALAAVQELPDPDNSTTNATDAGKQWLTKNGAEGDLADNCAEPSDCSPCVIDDRIVYCDCHDDGSGSWDTVRVCVRRESPGIFAALSNIDFVWVSAAATATVGPAGIATVWPVAIVPPDTDCDAVGETCLVDLNGDTDTDDPGEACTFTDCPFGLNPNKLYYFKCESGSCNDDYTPGNFGSIGACEGGMANFRACLTGEETSTGFEVGEEVEVESEPGAGGINFHAALTELVEAEDEVLLDGSYPCDVHSTPDPENGLDPDVVAALTAEDGRADDAACQHRKVVVPIIQSFPSGGASEPILVLSLAVFYFANWDRAGPWGDAEGTTSDACGTASGSPVWPCGQVWGYLLFGQSPDSRFLLDQISDDPNPFAPLLIALIE